MECDVFLISIGRSPNTKGLALEKADVKVLKNGMIETNDKWQSVSQPHIYGVGDCVKGTMLAHKAEEEAIAAADHILHGKGHVNYDCIPGVIYTHPEVAWVGLSEVQAKEQGIDYEKSIFPWKASGRSLSLGREEGLTKMIFDKKTHKVLGGGIVGSRAGDLISEIALAIEMGCEAEDIALTIHPHPTVSETIAQATEIFEGTITDLPNTKK